MDAKKPKRTTAKISKETTMQVATVNVEAKPETKHTVNVDAKATSDAHVSETKASEVKVSESKQKRKAKENAVAVAKVAHAVIQSGDASSAPVAEKKTRSKSASKKSKFEKNTDGKDNLTEQAKEVSEKKNAEKMSTSKHTEAKNTETKNAESKQAGAEAKQTGDAPKSARKLLPKKLDERGIHIGAARVKQVILEECINPREYRVQRLITAAENKPITPKPTKTNPAPLAVQNGKHTELNMIVAELEQVIHESTQYTTEQLKVRHNTGVKNYYINELENATKACGAAFNISAFNSQFTELAQDFKRIMEAAEVSHSNSLKNSYEADYLKNLSESDGERYNKEYTEAKKNVAKHNKDVEAKAKTLDASKRQEVLKELKTFDEKAFNLHFNPDFYKGFDVFKVNNDKSIVGKTYESKTHTNTIPLSPWARADRLIGKLCSRISGNTRNIVACFLDRLVEQLATNGLHNALKHGKHTLLLEHAVERSDGYLTRAPLYRFVSTFNHYEQILKYIEDKAAAKMQHAQAIQDAKLKAKADHQRINQELKAAKNAADKNTVDKGETKGVEVKTVDDKVKSDENSESKVVSMPDYPKMKQLYSFDGYINTICNNVKFRLAETTTTDADKEKIHGVSVGREFKQFCSFIVYEAILRIGESLRKTVEHGKVKTISDKMVTDVLQQIHTLSGVSYDTVNQRMVSAMSKFKELRAKKADERKKAAEKTGAAASTEQSSASEPKATEADLVYE